MLFLLIVFIVNSVVLLLIVLFLLIVFFVNCVVLVNCLVLVNCVVLLIIVSLCVLSVCKCVPYCCHRVSNPTAVNKYTISHKISTAVRCTGVLISP